MQLLALRALALSPRDLGYGGVSPASPQRGRDSAQAVVLGGAWGQEALGRGCLILPVWAGQGGKGERQLCWGVSQSLPLPRPFYQRSTEEAHRARQVTTTPRSVWQGAKTSRVTGVWGVAVSSEQVSKGQTDSRWEKGGDNMRRS